MDVVDNFPYQALRDYYETWYRPDLQGIMIVGDIDEDRIEAKVKELFGSIEMPANAPERTVFTVEDNEAPIIKNVHYYEYQEGVDVSELLELSSFDLDDWQTKNVLITYTVTDNNLSGLASGSGHTSKTEVGTTWDCQLLLDGTTSSQKVIYVDAVGNRTEQTFTLKIDTTQTQLDNVITLNYQTYLGYYAELGYCPVEVYINFKPIFGASGAYLEYSYELDENGQEIWIRYDAELKANIPNQFVLDFDIDNS